MTAHSDRMNGLAASLHVIVTCTDRKTTSVPDNLRLGNVKIGSADMRAAAWIDRLTGTTTVGTIPARSLYAGEHWQTALRLPDLIDSMHGHLWTCSAGYGLIPDDAPLRPYAATFASGHPDSVRMGTIDPSEWWRVLAAWDGPSPGQPRTIRALTEADPKASYLLVLSASYLSACSTDIAAASGSVADPDQFIVVSAGTRNGGVLDGLLVPADARLQTYLGGTRQTLNVRVAADLLSKGFTGRAEVARYLADLLEAQPPIRRYEREKLTDEQVLTMIGDALTRVPGASASSLLREFRDAGYACEQARFAALHRSLAKATT
jgi:hypothetical protein